MQIKIGKAESLNPKMRKLHNLCTQTRITPKETIINMAYQRVLTKAAIAQVTPFDIRLMSLPYVAEIDYDRKTGKGIYEVIDGQARIHVFKETYGDNVEFDVQVLENSTLQERAYFFNVLNEHRTSVSPTDRFKARVTAEDPESVVIYELIKASGIKVGGLDNVAKTTAYPVTNSIDKLIQIYKHGSLATVLNIIFEAYKNTNADYSNKCLSHKMITSIDMVVTAFRDKYDVNRLVEVISKESSSTWNNSGVGVVLSREKKKVFAAESIVTAYNK